MITLQARERRRSAPNAPPLSFTRHRQLLDGEFWRKIPAYSHISAKEFGDHRFQTKNTITRPQQLVEIAGSLAPKSFFDDVIEGIARAPMNIRVSPYLLSLIDWDDPYADPLRRQFIPVGSRLLPDHPMVRLDSLGERHDSPVPGLVHRYRDRVLLLALDTCPVYCRFCTRSYAVGTDTAEVTKVSLKTKPERWSLAFEYLRSQPDVEDVLVSGGDSYNLRPDQIEHLGNELLSLPNILRIRFATKGPAVMPQKLISDEAWVDALTRLVARGRSEHKEVALHVHFNHPTEITQITKQAMDRLFSRGITVRNQTVLQRGVNDSVGVMRELNRRLGYCNVHPYYTYIHDLIKGVEDLRTTVQTAVELEKRVRGDTTGFNTPAFVCDAPQGGGKRTIHSFEHYDRENGIAVYSAPSVKSGYFLYFDPIHLLPEEGRRRWNVAGERQLMVQAAVEAARTHRRAVRSATNIDSEDAEGPVYGEAFS